VTIRKPGRRFGQGLHMEGMQSDYQSLLNTLSKETAVISTKKKNKRFLGWQLAGQALKPESLTGLRIIIVTLISLASLITEDSD